MVSVELVLRAEVFRRTYGYFPNFSLYCMDWALVERPEIRLRLSPPIFDENFNDHTQDSQESPSPRGEHYQNSVLIGLSPRSKLLV